jgi:tol-pal system protein YbgF
MHKLFLLLLSAIFSCQVTLADGPGLAPIIQRQSKQIQELKSKVQDLEQTVEKLKYIVKTKEAVTSDNNQTNTAESQVQIIPVDANHKDQVNFFDTNKVAKQPSDKAEYDLALAALKEGRFGEAEQKFASFIANHPSSKLQSNATFWYAETFYRQGLFNKAAINYLQSYKRFPGGSKAPDALLKLSYALVSLNKNNEACSILEKLNKEFPERPIASIERAKEASSKFHCK